MPSPFKDRWQSVSFRMADGLLIFVRHVLTVVLLWLRIPLMWILSIISVLSFFVGIFSWLVNDGTHRLQTPMTWGMFITSVVSFGLMYAYNILLGWVSPNPLVMVGID